MKRILPILKVGTLLAGCAPQALFYWDDYSETLYQYKKAPDDKSLAERVKSLEKIITESPKQRKAVPPGVYAEYGYILLKQGKVPEGMGNLDKEAKLYPESSIFVGRLKEEYTRGAK